MVGWIFGSMILGLILFIIYVINFISTLDLRDNNIKRIGMADNEVLIEMRRDYLFCSVIEEDEKLQTYQVYKTLSRKEQSNSNDEQLIITPGGWKI